MEIFISLKVLRFKAELYCLAEGFIYSIQCDDLVKVRIFHLGQCLVAALLVQELLCERFLHRESCLVVIDLRL